MYLAVAGLGRKIIMIGVDIQQMNRQKIAIVCRRGRLATRTRTGLAVENIGNPNAAIALVRAIIRGAAFGAKNWGYTSEIWVNKKLESNHSRSNRPLQQHLADHEFSDFCYLFTIFTSSRTALPKLIDFRLKIVIERSSSCLEQINCAAQINTNFSWLKLNGFVTFVFRIV